MLQETLRNGKLSSQHCGAGASRNRLEAVVEEAAAVLIPTVGIKAARAMLPPPLVQWQAAPVRSVQSPLQ